MTSPQQALQMLLQPAGLQQTLFPSNSRYHGIAVASLTDQDGKTIRYIQRRFVPQPESLALLQEHRLSQGQRLDQIAELYFADALQFWRICDANRAMRPQALTEPSQQPLDGAARVLRITLPEGVAGMAGAGMGG